MHEVHCCEHEQCGSSIIDISTPATLRRDFDNWLNGIENSNEPSSSEESPSEEAKSLKPTDGRKNRKKGTNLYGRPYCPGRPLSMTERTRIIQLHNNGMKVNAISKSLCISHGCVSKIISRYRATGILLPACSPEQRKSRKRKSDGSSPFLPNYNNGVADANGNEYLNEYGTRYNFQIQNFNTTNTENPTVYEYSIAL